MCFRTQSNSQHQPLTSVTIRCFSWIGFSKDRISDRIGNRGSRSSSLIALIIRISFIVGSLMRRMRRSRCPFYGAQHWQWYFRQIREILSSITSQVVDRSRLRLPPFFRGSTYLRSLSCPCHCFAFAFLPLGIKGGRRPIFHSKKLFIARPQETDSLRQLQVNLQNREEGYFISKVNRSRNQNRTRKQGVDPLLLTMVEGMPLFQCVLTTSQEQRQRLRGNTFRSRRGMRTTGEQFSDEGTDPLFPQSFGFTDQKKARSSSLEDRPSARGYGFY